MTASTSELLLTRRGSLGRITLNRPGSINALTLGMIRGVRTALAEWRTIPSVHTILIDGAGERGLCAGGDVRALWESARGDRAFGRTFWAEEYQMIAEIACYPKPVVALMDGLVMGGGVGISGHARHRVVTERSALAMPETLIGFTPDVGGSWLLARAPGAIGTRLALTGGRIGAADALFCGLADHFVPSARLDEVVERLTKETAETTLAEFDAAPAAAPLRTRPGWIDHAYAAPDAEAIMQRLRSKPEAAQDVVELGGKSPLALKVTLRSIRSASTLPGLSAALEQEYRLACALLQEPDFAEGVRAQLIDKDRRPRWSPSTLEAVTDQHVEAIFGASDYDFKIQV